MVVKCVLCDWESKTFQEEGFDILKDRLQDHIEENHLDTVIEVWMNNQNADEFKDIE